MAISATAGGALTLWDVERTEVAKALPSEHLSAIWGVDVNWDLQRCVTASDDKTLKLWDIDREKATSIRGHDDAVTCVQADWVGGQIMSGSMDKLIKQWDMKTME